MRRLHSLSCALVVLASACVQPVRTQPNPSQRAASFFEALSAQRWRDAAALVHPQRRSSFQEEQMALLVGWASQRDEIRQLRSDSGSGGVVSMGATAPRWRDQLPAVAELPVPGFGEATTLAATAALPPDEFLARFLEASALDANVTLKASNARIARRVVGEVVESHEVAHILYRLEGPSVHSEDQYGVELLRLRRHDGEWLVWPLHSNIEFASGTRLQLLALLGGEHPPDGD